ncbi:hypothetical protein ACOMHN_001244 [Nucella lapillus]
MSYATRKRRHELTLGDRMEVISMIDNRKSQTEVARVYNCSQSQISRIVSKREEIFAEWENCDDPEQKYSRVAKGTFKFHYGKDEAAPTVADQSTSPRPPSESAYDGTEQTPETPNNGWLEYWKNHSSSYGRQSFQDFDPEYSPWNRQSGSGGKHGPKGRPKPSSNKESRISNQMLDILKNYDVCDVYCADELALQYDAMPNLDTSDDEGDDEGGDDRKVKDTACHKQMTVLLTCNVTGSDKRDLLIIEDSESDDASGVIEGCQRARAPRAWMTADVYREFLVALDYDMRQQRRYILLLVDNADPHEADASRTLEHVRVLYMRSYTTPFFHGLFYSVRAHYRKQILLKLVASNPELMSPQGEEGPRQGGGGGALAGVVEIDTEEAVNMLKLAWKSVSAQDVVQCFSKSGLCAPHIHGLPQATGAVTLPDLPPGLVSDEQYEDFVNLDVDAPCTGDAHLTSAHCRILADLRDQGFTDVGLEPPDDDPDTGVNSSGGSSSGKGDVVGFDRPDKRRTPGGGGEVERSLSTLRNFLEQRGLHLHNLHALEAQIYSCHSGGH